MYTKLASRVMAHHMQCLQLVLLPKATDVALVPDTLPGGGRSDVVWVPLSRDASLGCRTATHGSRCSRAAAGQRMAAAMQGSLSACRSHNGAVVGLAAGWGGARKLGDFSTEIDGMYATRTVVLSLPLPSLDSLWHPILGFPNIHGISKPC